jgi:hypothetical protein
LDSGRAKPGAIIEAAAGGGWIELGDKGRIETARRETRLRLS